MKESQHTHISAKHNYFDLKLKEVFKYRGLIWLLVVRHFKVSYKQTVLGPVWLFAGPLCTSIFQMILFGNIARLGTDGIPQILFYLSGNAVWGYFSACLSGNAGSFTGNAGLFSKVYFPRLVMPLTNVISNAFSFGIRMILVVILMIYFAFAGAISPSWWAPLLILLILVNLGILGMGVGIIISSLTTKYRDLSVLVSFGVTLWSYATPVVYPLSTVKDEWLLKLILMNPVTPSVELFRYAMFGTGTVLPVSMLISCVLTACIALLGIVVFNRVERNFTDTV